MEHCITIAQTGCRSCYKNWMDAVEYMAKLAEQHIAFSYAWE